MHTEEIVCLAKLENYYNRNDIYKNLSKKSNFVLQQRFFLQKIWKLHVNKDFSILLENLSNRGRFKEYLEKH